MVGHLDRPYNWYELSFQSSSLRPTYLFTLLFLKLIVPNVLTIALQIRELLLTKRLQSSIWPPSVQSELRRPLGFNHQSDHPSVQSEVLSVPCRAAFWHLSVWGLYVKLFFFSCFSGWKGTSGLGLMFWEGFQVLWSFKASEACTSKQRSLRWITP